MKKINLFIIIMTFITVMMSSTVYAANTSTKIKVTMNNKTVKYERKPYLKDGEVMLPVKQTSEAIGATVELDKKKKTTMVNLNMMHVELIIGKSEFYIHRDADFSGIPQTVKLSTPIKSVNGTVYITGKTFLESLGMNVNWDNKNKVFSITKDKSNRSDLSKSITYNIITKDDISGIKKVSKWFNNNYKKSGIHYVKHDGVMYVLIGAGKKSTRGYTVGINKITYDTATKAYIYANVKRPTPDQREPKITYPYLLIKITGNKNLNKVKGELPEIIIDKVPTKVPYEEITSDSIKDNSTLINWYNENNQKQGIHYIRDGKYIYTLISAGEKPTGGYTIKIDNIFYSTYDSITVNAKVTPPGDNVRVIMVITYPSSLIRIESDRIKTVIGEILDIKTSSKEKWITMDASTVTKMELYSLDQVKIRDIIGTEEEDIMKSFNEATLDPNPYVKMIAGNLLKVTTNDGYVLTFTSYGSQTNVIVNFEKDGESRTFHLKAPVIAKTLLK